MGSQIILSIFDQFEKDRLTVLQSSTHKDSSFNVIVFR
jgi:hypothetical protein